MNHRVGAAARRSGLPQGSTECREGKHNGVQFLKIPQLCKIKTDGSRIVQPAGFDALDEILHAALHRGLIVGGGEVEQDFDGERSFLDARRRAAAAAPTAIGVLIDEKPTNAALRRDEMCQAEIAVRSENFRSAVGGIDVVRGVLVAEPQWQPGTIRSLIARNVR